MRQPTPRRVVLAAVLALAVGMGVVGVIGGFSVSTPVRLMAASSSCSRSS
jgi:hypothetical protein